MTDIVSTADQAIRIIRYIGDAVRETGEPVKDLSLDDLADAVGAKPRFVYRLLKDISLEDYAPEEPLPPHPSNLALLRYDEWTDPIRFLDVSLTLIGWEKYEALARGEDKDTDKFTDSYDFLFASPGSLGWLRDPYEGPLSKMASGAAVGF